MFESTDKIAFANDCCRICTNQCGSSGASIFEYIVDVNERPAEMLEYCLQQPVDTSNQFPEYICIDCIPNLIETFKFFTLYKKSEEYFKELYWRRKQQNQNTTMVHNDCIKVEPITIVSSNHSGCTIDDSDNDNEHEDVPIDLKDQPGVDNDEINTAEVVVFVEPLAVTLYEEDENNDAAERAVEKAVEHVNSINEHPNENDYYDDDDDDDDNETMTRSVQKKGFKCSICVNQYFSEKSLLIEHEKFHLRTFECFACKKLFQRFVDLGWHMREHTVGKSQITNNDPHQSDAIEKLCDMKGKKHPWMDIIFTDDGGKQFVCKICGKEFAKKNCIYQHRFKVHKEGRFQCTVCSKGCVSKASLKIHIRTHLPAELLKCPSCNRLIRGKFRMQVHLKKCAPHMAVEVKTFECTLCNRKFNDEKKFERHQKKHIALLCDHCTETFKHRDILDDHLSIAHANELRNFNCDTCPAVFPLKSLLKLHAPQCRKQMEGKHLCHECGNVFKTGPGLRAHQSVVHSSERKFACNHCPNKYKTKACLKSHLLHVHVKEPNYFCDLCGASYSSRGSLRIHRIKHSNNRPYACETCPAKFYTNYKLQVHIRTHTGERPHKCDHCDRAFTQKGDMTKHMLVHLGPTPHKCTESGCKESFRLETELRKHSYSHFKPPES